MREREKPAKAQEGSEFRENNEDPKSSNWAQRLVPFGAVSLIIALATTPVVCNAIRRPAGPAPMPVVSPYQRNSIHFFSRPQSHEWSPTGSMRNIHEAVKLIDALDKSVATDPDTRKLIETLKRSEFAPSDIRVPNFDSEIPLPTKKNNIEVIPIEANSEFNIYLGAKLIVLADVHENGAHNSPGFDWRKLGDKISYYQSMQQVYERGLKRSETLINIIEKDPDLELKLKIVGKAPNFALCYFRLELMLKKADNDLRLAVLRIAEKLDSVVQEHKRKAAPTPAENDSAWRLREASSRLQTSVDYLTPRDLLGSFRTAEDGDKNGETHHGSVMKKVLPDLEILLENNPIDRARVRDLIRKLDEALHDSFYVEAVRYRFEVFGGGPRRMLPTSVDKITNR